MAGERAPEEKTSPAARDRGNKKALRDAERFSNAECFQIVGIPVVLTKKIEFFASVRINITLLEMEYQDLFVKSRK